MQEFDINHQKLPNTDDSGISQKVESIWKFIKEKVSQVRSVL